MFADKIIRPAYRAFRAGVMQRLMPISSAPLVMGPDKVVEVVGFFRSLSGIGESARLCALSLKESGIPVRCISVESVFRKPEQCAWTFDDAPADWPVATRIFHLNPPMMPPAILSMGRERFSTAYNIGYWAWELEEVPAEWARAMARGYVNAVLTPSEFTSTALRAYTSRPVMTVPHPVHLAEVSPAQGMRERLGIVADDFLVSGVFAFGSAMERKNPQALIAAFKKAFPEGRGATLVLKSNSGSESEKKIIADMIGAAANIQLIDAYWSKEDLAGLMAASDLFASLHRSEGFGLPIAEALLLGVPVMATDWSGNTDFCTRENGFPVPYTRIPVVSAHPEFADLSRLTWADADTDAAARILRDAADNRDILESRKIRARDSVLGYLHRRTYADVLSVLSHEREAA